MEPIENVEVQNNLPEDFKSGHEILLEENGGIDPKSQIPEEATVEAPQEATEASEPIVETPAEESVETPIESLSE